MLTTLELLQETERLLNSNADEFEFTDWSRCTCGFIYAAHQQGEFLPARGDRVSNPYAHRAMERDPVYANAITKVATALGWTPNYMLLNTNDGTITRQAMTFVSDKTSTGSEQFGGYRKAALAIVREAIEKVKAHEEAMRVKVINDAHFAPVAA